MNKKVIVISCLVMFLFNLSSHVFAYSSMTVSVGSVETSPLTDIEIPITISHNVGFSNLAIEIEYDSSVMTLTSVETQVDGASFTVASDIDRIPFNMQWDSAGNVELNGTVAILKFNIKNDAPNGNYSINISHYKGRNKDNVDGSDVNYNADFESLNLSYVNGCVKIINSNYNKIDVFVNDKVIRFISNHVICGKIFIVGFDDDNSIISINDYQANEFVESTNLTNLSYVKIMWLETNSLAPLSKPGLIYFNEK